MKFTVRAPASTANLGPGFDCLGAALSLYVFVEVDTRRTARGAWTFAGLDREPPEPTVIHKAIAAVLPDEEPPGLAVRSEIPLGGGLGSSAAAIAAGLLIGCKLAGRKPDPAELLKVGIWLEGHGDNLAPALFGGLTLVLPDAEAVKLKPVTRVRPAVLIPKRRVATEEARRKLEWGVRRDAAVANIARASGLLGVLSGSIPATAGRLLEFTVDLLHQDARFPLMPQTRQAIKRLRKEGVAAFVSGAGPSIGCLLLDDTEDAFAAAVSRIKGFEVCRPSWDLKGARVL